MNQMHPSGMTQERWDWPFKTPEERKLVVKYFNKLARESKQNKVDPALVYGEALL
jgi:hypothetical protein